MPDNTSPEKGSYVVETINKKRAGVVQEVNEDGSLEIRWSYGDVAESVEADTVEVSGFMTYYFQGPIQEVLLNTLAFGLTQKVSGGFKKQYDFNMTDLKYMAGANAVYEMSKTFFKRGGDYDRAFRLFSDPDASKVNDFFVQSDAYDSLNKSVSMAILDRILRPLIGKEKFFTFPFARYMQYFVAFYISNIVSRKTMGVKDDEDWKHY